MKLHETSAFRMAFRFAGLFSLIVLFALIYVYVTTLQEFKEQIDRELKQEIGILNNHYNKHGLDSLIQHTKNRQQYGRHLHHYYAVSDLTFKHLSGNDFLTGLIQTNQISPAQITFIDAHDVEHGDEDDNRLRIATQLIANNYWITTGQSNNSIEELEEHTFSAVIIAILVSIFSTMTIGIFMSRQVSAKTENINQGLEKAISSNFKQHLPIPKNEDEYHELTIKLNLMLSRIENLITGMRQVTDNIAHDLRSPLTRMRNRLEVTLLQSRNEDEYRDAMESAINDCSELLKTFNALLSITQAEAGVKRDDWNEIDLSELATEMAELYELVAEEQDLHFQWQKPESIKIEGNRQLLAQAISNLLENAIKFTPPTGTISLKLYIDKNHSYIGVCDTGPGISDHDKDKVIERFHRLDNARATPGNGLGLSLVNAVAKLHNGQLQLSDNNPGLCAYLKLKKTQ